MRKAVFLARMERLMPWRQFLPRTGTYASEVKELALPAKDFTHKRNHRNRPLTEADKQTNRRKSSARAKVEDPFLRRKRILGLAKVRYRGLTKNANCAFAMLALVNLEELAEFRATGRPWETMFAF